MDEPKTLGEYMNVIRREISEREKWMPVQLIPWRELAKRCELPAGGHIPENNILRWKDDAGRPGSIEYIVALSTVFGAGVLDFVDVELDRDLAWLWARRNIPHVAHEIEKARERAEKIEQTRGEPTKLLATQA